MKLLFKSSWKELSAATDLTQKVKDYCRSLARHLVSSPHQIILTSSTRAGEQFIAQEIISLLKGSGRKVKEHLIYLLPEPVENIPSEGKVLTFEQSRWRTEERTFQIQQADAIIAFGGGKGTLDCIQKAFLAEKPVFVACAIPGSAANAWKKRSASYHYVKAGDAEFVNDIAITPDDFFDEVFRVIDSIGEMKYSRRIFIVHGRELVARNNLESLLKRLGFEPVILQKEASHGLTIIENLERDTASVGFGFVIYTPDDLGRLQGETEKPRARQNVIFEHGLLMGRLGRERTCALVQSDVEIPSDLHGVLHVRFNNLEEDAIQVARVLKKAGYTVDADILI
jgi:Predicted nucleotide-binding protein containing TIR -like domain